MGLDLGDNVFKDVCWLSSLSESELDLLIDLKKSAVDRAKIMGDDTLANKIDLKVLQLLGCSLVRYIRKEIKDLGGLELSGDFKSLLDSDLDYSMSAEELSALICNASRKRVKV